MESTLKESSNPHEEATPTHKWGPHQLQSQLVVPSFLSLFQLPLSRGPGTWRSQSPS